MANHKIEDIEGIGAIKGKQFRAAGVKSTDSLLANTCTPKQRKELAAKTGLSEAQILEFANRADLYRINRHITPPRRVYHRPSGDRSL